MALSTLEYLINVKDPSRKGRLVAFDSGGTLSGAQRYIRGETPLVSLRCVEPSVSGPRLWDDLNLESARAAGGIRFGLGEFDKAPTSGDFDLAYNGSSTGLTALGYAITAADLKTALNAHAGIAAAGGIATVAQSGRSYRIAFTTVGAKAAFTTPDDNNLLPLSRVSISRVRTGDVDTKEVVVIKVKRRAYAFCDAWTAAPAAAVTVTTAIVGDDAPATNCVQVITFTPGTYGGTGSLAVVLPNVVTGDGTGTTTANIIVVGNENADQLLGRLQAHPEAVSDDVSNLSVTGNVGGPFTVTFVNELKARVITEMVGSNINLLAPRTLTGPLSLNNDAMAAAFDDAGSNTLTLTAELEIEEPGSSPATPYQDSAEVGKDVLDFETMLPAPVSSYPLPGLVPQFRRDITSFALMGAVVTAAGGVQCLIVDIAGAPRIWGLFAGTDATDTAAGVKRPDDYNASTNAYVWKSIV